MGDVCADGNNRFGQCNIPALEERIPLQQAGKSYIQVSAGLGHTVLLDGCAVACGCNKKPCDIPPLEVAMSYTKVSTGGGHTVLLRSDGRAAACGRNIHGQCNIPPLDEGILYTKVCAGLNHTVFLRSDGSAAACGLNAHGQCSIPPLDEGMSYIQVSAGGETTFLLRSDGFVVAFGNNRFGVCDIPCPGSGTSYVDNSLPHSQQDIVLQLDLVQFGNEIMLTCSGLTGKEILSLNACGSDLAWSTHKHIAHKLKINIHRLQLLLPDGKLLAFICREKRPHWRM